MKYNHSRHNMTPNLMLCVFFVVFFCRGQEQNIRFEHIYLPEPSIQSDVEYAEIKRPRLDIGPESLMRPSSHRTSLPLGGAEDMAKVSSHYKIPCEKTNMTKKEFYMHNVLTTLQKHFKCS